MTARHISTFTDSADQDDPATYVADEILRDYDCLRALAQAEDWNHDTPVSPNVFEELWTNGLPAGWEKLFGATLK